MKAGTLTEESGFGLIEVIVAMALMGIIAVSFIPFMLNSIKSVDRDMTIANATQVVNERLNLAKNAGAQSCDAFKGAITEISNAVNTNLNDGQPLEDGRGLSLTATTVLSDFDGNTLNISTFECKPYMQVSVRVTGNLRGNDTNYTYARASAYVRINGAQTDGATP